MAAGGPQPRRCFIRSTTRAARASWVERRPLLSARLSSRQLLGRDFARFRQTDRESRSLAELTLHLDAPAIACHNSMYHGQAQAGAPADLAGGVERLKNSPLRRLVHAAARILYREQHLARFGVRSEAHGDGAGTAADRP